MPNSGDQNQPAKMSASMLSPEYKEMLGSPQMEEEKKETITFPSDEEYAAACRLITRYW